MVSRAICTDQQLAAWWCLRNLIPPLELTNSRTNRSEYSIPLVDAYPGANGLAVWRHPDGFLHLWWQDSATTLRELAYSHVNFNERSVNGPLSNALAGTSISSFIDDSNQPHVFFQTNDPGNPVVDWSCNAATNACGYGKISWLSRVRTFA